MSRQEKQTITDPNFYKVFKIFTDIGTAYKLLNKKEERALIEKYKNDRVTLNELLIKHNIRIVLNIANKYVYRPSVNNPADMLIDGFVGLMTAAERFDIDRNIKFNTYATSWVFKYIIAHFYYRSPKTGVNAFSLNRHVGDFENTELSSLISIKDYDLEYLNKISVPNFISEVSSSLINDLLQKACNDLNIEEGSFSEAIISKHLMRGESLAKLSAEYKVKYSDATLEKRIISKKLKEAFTKAGITDVSSVF